MATATSRTSLDPPVELPNPHPRLADLAPAAHPQVRRVSSESQSPGRASPSPRITRRTPVPFLLEAFPAPPSHIPGTPSSLTSSILNSPSLLTSPSTWLSSTSAGPAPPSNVNATAPAAILAPPTNPPPSSPPTGPLPPLPGPSSVTADILATHLALQSAARSASPALSVSDSYRSQSRTEQRPRLSIDVNDSVRGRVRQGSLSSLRNSIYPMVEHSEAIAEEPVEDPRPPPPHAATPHSPPLFGSVAERRSHDQSRGDSPDILRSCLSHVGAASHRRPDNRSYIEDSIASVDMSDLTALKSDNEGDADDQASRPFPPSPPLPHSPSQSQRRADPPSSAPPYVHTPRKPSKYSVRVSCDSEDMNSRRGAMSPEITQIISATPRPRKRSTPSRSRQPSFTRNRKESSRSQRESDEPLVPTRVKTPLVKKAARRSKDREGLQDGGNDSDSSLDLHTPLPQLMLQHGMLSPNSKLLPRHESDSTRLSIVSSISSSSHVSNASNLSLLSTTSTCSKHPKDARDTPQRRVRHRDGKLLKGGIGLTTGLGWSDSEDEDAPSLLTRRVSSLVLSRRASSSSVASYRSSPCLPHPLSRSISHNILREVDEYENECDADEFGGSHRVSLATTRSLPSRSKPLSRVGSIRSTGSSLGRYSTYSTSSVAPAVIRARASSVSDSSAYATSLSSKPDNLSSMDAHTSSGLMPGIREQDDGVTPTRAVFERSSLGSRGSSGADIPHTPSSTASSASLPFPVTPEGGAEIPQLQPIYNQDKVLPPLPLSAKGKYSSTLSLRSQSGGLQRPRTYSNTSSVSNSSMIRPPSGDAKSTSVSSASTPKQSLVGRPTKAAIPAGSPRPSLNGTPRPSLTIPKSPLPPQSATSGLPRPTTPSSPCATAGQGYAPRPLRLVSRSSPLPPNSPTSISSPPLPTQTEVNQSQGKILQPGEQPQRPGQVLTYNRNVHDQLKLRTLSLNTGPNRTQAAAVSPGGAQTLIMSSGTTSAPDSALTTPVTACSQSPLASPGLGPGGEGTRPRPRTGTGMMYRTNLSVGSAPASRIRVPSTISR